MSIVEFLLARIAEDETVARAVRTELDRVRPRLLRVYTEDAALWEADEPVPHVASDSVRALAECQAKRAIVDDHDIVHECPGGKNLVSDPDLEDGSYGGPCATLRHLAAVYADHPDYQPEWRP